MKMKMMMINTKKYKNSNFKLNSKNRRDKTLLTEVFSSWAINKKTIKMEVGLDFSFQT